MSESGWIQPHVADVPQHEEVAAPNMAIAGGQSFEYSAATGEVKVAFSQAEAHTDSLPGQAPQGILATARTQFGSPARELRPDTLVTVDGSRTTLAAAEALGLVRRDELGRYVETTAADRSAPQREGAEEAEEHQMVPFAPADEAELIQLVQDVPHQILGSLMVETAIRAAETGDLGVNVEAVVSRTGMSMEAASRFVDRASTLFQEQAAAALQKANVDPEQFLAWAMEHRKDQLRTAFVNHVTVRSLAGYRALAKDFIQSVVPTAESLQQAGYPTRIHGQTGELLVKIGGDWMSAAVAARQGLI